MTRLWIRLLAGLVAGAAGFYLGLFALLAVAGLERPEWAPVVMTSAAAGLGTAAIATVAKLPLPTIALATLAAGSAGALLGLAFGGLVDSYELTIAAAALMVVGAAVAIPSSRTDHSGS